MPERSLESFGRYKIQRVLGKGAMGVVYEGLDPKLNRKVAIKTILVGSLDEATAREYSKRFAREAQAVARLNHPNIVQVYDFGEEGDVAYIVMEYVRGKELKSSFDGGERFEIGQAVRLMTELLSAMDFAHNAGVIHRDIKPANVMVDSDGHAKLADFGVARISDPESQTGATQAGTMVGTPAYMSPEQIQGQKIDRRTDIFSAGVILYQFLTGQRPFQGGGAWTMAKKIVHDDPPAPSSLIATISPGYDQVVYRALAKHPDHRYQSAQQFADALQRVIKGLPAQDPNEDDDRTDLKSVPAATPAPALSEEETQRSSEVELEFWRAIKDNDDAEELGLYLEEFPQGVYSDLARHKIAVLRRPAGQSAEEAERQIKKKADDEKAKREAEEKARRDAQLKAKRDAEERARKEAEEKARKAADEKAKRAAEERARLEAQEKARREAVAKAKREAEDKARRESEERARLEAQEKARREAVAKAKRDAEEKARLDALVRAKREADERARREAEEAARREAEEKRRLEAEAKARREAEERARIAAEEKARREAEEKARLAALEKARREAEEKARREAEAKARHEAEERARAEAEETARREAEERAEKVRQEAEARARRAAEESARRKAEELARRETEERARIEAEAKARREAEELLRREAEERARRETEEQARREAEAKAQREAEIRARLQAQAKARHDAQQNALRAAERKAVRAAEVYRKRVAKERALREAEARAVLELQERARQEAQCKADQEAKNRAEQEAQAWARREAEEARRKSEVMASRAARQQAQREHEAKVKLEVEALLNQQKQLASSEKPAARPASPAGRTTGVRARLASAFLGAFSGGKPSARENSFESAQALEAAGRLGEAVQVLKQAANEGDSAAAKRLSELYAAGAPGLSRDEKQSVRWRAVAKALEEDVSLAKRKA